MKRFYVTKTFLDLLVFLAPGIIACGEEDKPKLQGWVRVGDLGPTPERMNDLFPLYDQMNNGHWETYEPMHDEFETTGLDEEKWHPRNPEWDGRPPSYFSSAKVELDGEKLHLWVKNKDLPEMLELEEYHTYTTAAVQSTSKVKYGYFEVRAKALPLRAASSFWFYKLKEGYGFFEIDVFELGCGIPGKEGRINMDLHVEWPPVVEEHFQAPESWSAPCDLSQDYHVYGMKWEKDRISWYFDGVVIRWIENGYWHEPMTLNVDIETMPAWFHGLPDIDKLPDVYSIDYVRAWKREKN